MKNTEVPEGVIHRGTGKVGDGLVPNYLILCEPPTHPANIRTEPLQVFNRQIELILACVQ